MTWRVGGGVLYCSTQKTKRKDSVGPLTCCSYQTDLKLTDKCSMQHRTAKRQTSKMVPSPTYWMSLSHTLHHLSPGSPNGHPESTRTKKERKEDSQNISRIFQVKLRASSVSAVTQNSQQGETNSRINHRGWTVGGGNWVAQNHQVERNEGENEQLLHSFEMNGIKLTKNC